jgi:competence protein ComEC
MNWFLVLASFVLTQSVEAQNSTLTARRQQPSFSIRQLDVGQGDAALLTTPEGRRILIDAGPDKNAVAAILLNAGIDTLDLVVASHAHADHIGGMSEVFSAFVVRAYLDNGIPYTTATYARTLASVENEAGMQYFQPTDRKITVGSVTIRVLPPPQIDHSQNNNSVGLLVEYGRFRALYTGDSEQAELSQWLRDGRVSQVTLVKAAHHGSGNGVTNELVAATSPAIVLISVGSRNRYGHPSPEVEQLWKAANARVYRTDQVGEIEIKASRDGSFTVHTGADSGIRAR